MERVDERILVGVVVPPAGDWSPDPLPEDLEGLRAHGLLERTTTGTTAAGEGDLNAATDDD